MPSLAGFFRKCPGAGLNLPRVVGCTESFRTLIRFYQDFISLTSGAAMKSCVVYLVSLRVTDAADPLQVELGGSGRGSEVV